ncbi:small integral membrane protein 29-like [Kryptolebias marmoratus]|uniref:small integral membrane protein 29-like n=1 Tax=Kryptolebias marmoratus TaxID=37003 RepID=UPI0018ACA064|nr:small integral membrane protein 29-like [Kryptolebias marmoratus]
MNQNHTTPLTSAPHNKPTFSGYYALIPLLLLTVIGCIVAVVCYLKRRSRLDELRHRLIPLYSYDPTEVEEEWDEADKRNEEEELAEPLYKEARLSFPSDYGT